MFGTSIKVAGAAVVAAGVLAGCSGGPVKMGAAATVGDDRITVTSLDQAVRDWQKQFSTDPVANQLRSDSADPAQQLGAESLSEPDMRGALSALVNFRVGAQVAKAEGLPVSEGQVDQVVAELDQRGGAGSITLANGLPRRYTRDVARFLTTQLLLARKFGADGNAQSPAQAQAQQQSNLLFANTARGMDIKINPRFGTFDPTRVTINPVKYRLSSTESGIGRP